VDATPGVCGSGVCSRGGGAWWWDGAEGCLLAGGGGGGWVADVDTPPGVGGSCIFSQV
jgi:hypothetical protein